MPTYLRAHGYPFTGDDRFVAFGEVGLHTPDYAATALKGNQNGELEKAADCRGDELTPRELLWRDLLG